MYLHCGAGDGTDSEMDKGLSFDDLVQVGWRRRKLK